MSLHTKKKLATLEQTKLDTLEKMRMQDIQNIKRNTQRKLMLDAMQMQSTRSWPTMGNLDGKINVNSVVPNTIMNYAEYYTKLQRLAMYADQGDYKSMQKVLDNQAVLARKNMLLQPLFRDLKSQIRHMSHTPEFALV